MKELSTDWKRRFRARLRAWYRKHRRDLPWRDSRDPYRVWISEIMLQQTQVATVREYFARFVERFPTVQHLAAAGEQEVLRLWEGLGYYRRARQLHAAAKEVVARYGGMLPCDVSNLQRLPGIGRYTAGAIASIAFDRPAAILEANTQRLYARLVAYPGDPGSSDGQRALWDVAELLVPRRAAGEFNQALMELGSLVCTPREPRCQACPVQSLCAAHSRGLVDRIPPPKRRQEYESRHEAAVVVRHNGGVLLRQCGPDERWAGLWDFPRVSLDVADGETVEGALAARIREQFGAAVTVRRHLATIKHGVTRYRITLDCFAASLVRGRRRAAFHSQLHWTKLEDLEHLPLCTTGRRIAGLVQNL